MTEETDKIIRQILGMMEQLTLENVALRQMLQSSVGLDFDKVNEEKRKHRAFVRRYFALLDTLATNDPKLLETLKTLVQSD